MTHALIAARPAFAAAALALAFLAGPAGAGEFTVRTVALPETKAVFGQVESRTVVPARARIGGTVKEIAVSEGSEVKEGETIALVVDDKLALELNSADARIKELRSQLENAQTELDRAQQLMARGVTSQSRLDTVKTQFDVAVNQVAAAEANRAVIAQRAREGEVLAPADGRVLTVPVTAGAVVLAGDVLARVASGQYYLRLSLPERHAAEIKEGGTVLIGERGIDATAARSAAAARPGRIVKVYPEISAGRVSADVDVAGLGDYFVNERTLVWIPVATRQAIVVPPDAVVTRHGVDYVRVKTATGATEVAVIPGERLDTPDGPRVEILTGLKDGDRIVLP